MSSWSIRCRAFSAISYRANFASAACAAPASRCYRSRKPSPTTSGNLIRQILGSFDEYQSAENGKHTLRAMRENANQNFWNGSPPPIGYIAVEVEKRGTRVKKRLAVDETEAKIVRRIYNLALGRAGLPLGVKAIAARLNADGVTIRGKPFHISNVHRILTGSTYHGVHVFNRRTSKTGAEKPREDWVTSTVPAIIHKETFETVQACLQARNPKQTPPRPLASPVLLTGIARCATCGSGMTLRTGKSGRYRYYTCAGCAQKGKTVCPGRSIAMAALDGMVTEHLCDNLFTPDRLVTILQTYLDRSAAADEARGERLPQARRRLTEAEGGLARLLELVEKGILPIDDPTLKDRLGAARTARDGAIEQVRLCTTSVPVATNASVPSRESEHQIKGLVVRPDGTIRRSRNTSLKGAAGAISPQKVDRLSRLMRERLRSGDIAFRKAYLRLFVGEVVVGDTELRLRGPKAALAKAAIQDEPATPDGLVPISVRKWRPRRDSNPRPQD